MLRALLLLLIPALLNAGELTTRKSLNLAAMKVMVAAAEAEAAKRGVQITICIVDESGNLLFLEKQDGASLNTIQFAQRKARHAAAFQSPSKSAADQVKAGNTAFLAFPDAFPNQGGLPVKVEGHTIGAIAVSGAASEVDEAIGQTAIEALMAWLQQK